VVIERFGFIVQENLIRVGRCPACDTPIAGSEMDSVAQRQSAA
jgi:hypothetical protein